MHGYDYSPDLQPHVVEIWSEVEDDSLRSLAYRLGVNYVPGLGFASLTAIKTMLRRLEVSGKPGRILYIADFDPAGQAMSIATARHCQFACWELEEVAGSVAPSIKVDNVAITAEQVEALGIPRIPIKEKDPRKARFELKHGVGAVEVEALDATHPHFLRDTLTERIKDLKDAGLKGRVKEAGEEAHAALADAVNEVVADHRDDLQDIARRSQQIADRYDGLYEALGEEVAERYRRLASRFERHMSPLRAQVGEIEDAVRRVLESLDVDLPDLPEGESREDEEREWLFDSERDFMEQTNHFRRAQGKE